MLPVAITMNSRCPEAASTPTAVEKPDFSHHIRRASDGAAVLDGGCMAHQQGWPPGGHQYVECAGSAMRARDCRSKPIRSPNSSQRPVGARNQRCPVVCMTPHPFPITGMSAYHHPRNDLAVGNQPDTGERQVSLPNRLNYDRTVAGG